MAAAGMYVEVFLAAMAAIVWMQTDSPVVQHHAVNVMLAASVVTLLFNLNPLMRFDGYYILSDLLDLPNLATHGQHDVKSIASRWLFAVDTQHPEWPEGRGMLIRCYGLAAFVWRILVCVSLTLAAGAIFHGAGIVLAAVGILLWVLLPAYRLVRYLIRGDAVNPPQRLRFVGILAGISLVSVAVWNYVPYIERLQLPAVVDCDPVVTIRTGASGFVRSVDVHSGEFVNAGQVLVQLENPQLESKMAETQLAIQQSERDGTRFHRGSFPDRTSEPGSAAATPG